MSHLTTNFYVALATGVVLIGAIALFVWVRRPPTVAEDLAKYARHSEAPQPQEDIWSPVPYQPERLAVTKFDIDNPEFEAAIKRNLLEDGVFDIIDEKDLQSKTIKEKQ